jgi:hypothetical protein
MTALLVIAGYALIGVGVWAEGRYSGRPLARDLPTLTIIGWPLAGVVFGIVFAAERLDGLGDRIEAFGDKRRRSLSVRVDGGKNADA